MGQGERKWLLSAFLPKDDEERGRLAASQHHWASPHIDVHQLRSSDGTRGETPSVSSRCFWHTKSASALLGERHHWPFALSGYSSLVVP